MLSLPSVHLITIFACLLVYVSNEAHGQCDPFNPSNVNTPLGPGARTLRVCITNCSYATPPELIVFYSRNQTAVSATQLPINSTASYGIGKAKYIKAAGSIMVYDFVFPHSGYTSINGSGTDIKPIEIPSRAADKSPVTVHFRLAVRNSTGIKYNASPQSFSMPDPITIGIVGDSYAAGEGAPRVPSRTAAGNLAAMWDDGVATTTTDVPCHRSLNSGLAKAVDHAKASNKVIAIQPFFVACSGAKTYELWSTQQRIDGINVPVQFEIIQSLLASRGYENLDILVMGVGGNDVGFAELIFDYMVVPFSDFQSDVAGQRKFTNPQDGAYVWSRLSTNYDALQKNIGERFRITELNTIFVCPPSPCKGPVGNPWCGHTQLVGNPVGDCWGLIEGDDRPAEFQALHEMVAMKMQTTMAEAAQRHKWSYVNLIDAAGQRGICNCSSPYFNTIGHSMANQGDFNGTAHPNVNGYEQMYKVPVANAVTKRINAIRTMWRYSSDCAADAKREAIEAAKRAVIEKINAKTAAMAISASQSVYPENVQQFRTRVFGTKWNNAITEYQNQVRLGQIVLPQPISFQIPQINFADRFSESK